MAAIRKHHPDVLAEMRGQLQSMTIDEVLSQGLHETLTWIVDTNGKLCEAIHEDYLDPPIEALRHE